MIHSIQSSLDVEVMNMGIVRRVKSLFTDLVVWYSITIL